MTSRLEIKEESARYTTVAITLHWLIAGLILLNLAIGPFMESFAEPYRTALVRVHESSGITILLLTTIRIVWRLSHRPPPLDDALPFSERCLAHSAHAVLYFAMIVLPLLGWAVISANPPQALAKASVAGGVNAAGRPSAERKGPPQKKRILLWGLVPLAPIKPIQDIALEPGGKERQHELHERLVDAHAVGGYLLLALLLLHVTGALKHEFFDRRAGLWRMGVGRRLADESALLPSAPLDVPPADAQKGAETQT